MFMLNILYFFLNTASGVFYPEHAETLPKMNNVDTVTPTFRSKTSISSLCGKDFTRRKYIQPPASSFTTNRKSIIVMWLLLVKAR